MSLAICEQGYTLTSLNNQHHMSRHELGWRMLQHIGLLLGCRPVCLRYVADLQNPFPEHGPAGRTAADSSRSESLEKIDGQRALTSPVPLSELSLWLPLPGRLGGSEPDEPVNHHAVACARVCVPRPAGAGTSKCSIARRPGALVRRSWHGRDHGKGFRSCVAQPIVPTHPCRPSIHHVCRIRCIYRGRGGTNRCCHTLVFVYEGHVPACHSVPCGGLHLHCLYCLLGQVSVPCSVCSLSQERLPAAAGVSCVAIACGKASLKSQTRTRADS